MSLDYYECRKTVIKIMNNKLFSVINTWHSPKQEKFCKLDIEHFYFYKVEVDHLRHHHLNCNLMLQQTVTSEHIVKYDI